MSDAFSSVRRNPADAAGLARRPLGIGSGSYPVDHRMSDAAPRYILIVKLSALGDVIMSLPALTALKKAFPEARVDWLVEAPAAGILKGRPLIDRLIVSPRHEVARLLKSGHAIQAARLCVKFLKELRSREYDVALDLQGLFKSGLLMRLARARRRLGFDRTREGAHLFLNEKIPAYDPERQAARRYLDAAVYLGAAYPEPEPEVYFQPLPEDRDRAAELLAPLGGRPYLVLNPGAKWATKRWPLAHWQKLAELAAADGRSLVLTGAGDDCAGAAAMEKAAPAGAALNLCGLTPLGVLAAVLERAALVVTADTGPMHLAAAVGARGLALFGPTKPWRTGPFGGRFQILTGPAECLGCLKRQCPTIHCMAGLRPETVWAAVRLLLP